MITSDGVILFKTVTGEGIGDMRYEGFNDTDVFECRDVGRR
jgi:hypothetical protein